MIETLEPRFALASISASASESTVYEGGVASYLLQSAPTKPADTFVSYTISNPDNHTILGVRFKIHGEADAYELDYSWSNVGYQKINAKLVQGSVAEWASGFDITASQDEFVPNSPDEFDLEDEFITVEMILDYTEETWEDYWTSGGIVQQATSTVWIDIKDNDTRTANMLLRSVDNSAAEPGYGLSTGQVTTVENPNMGTFELVVPEEWRGGGIDIRALGTASPGVDYSLVLKNPPLGAWIDTISYYQPLSTESTAVTHVNYRIHVPSREGLGSLALKIELTALGDSKVNEGTETAAFVFSSPSVPLISYFTTVYSGDPSEGYADVYFDEVRILKQTSNALINIDDAILAAVDIDTDSNNNGAIEGSPEEDAIEMQVPGNLLLLNDDDDNVNGVEDRNESLATRFIDDDLEPILLSYFSIADLTGFTLVIVGASNSSVNLWTSTDRLSLAKTVYEIGLEAIPEIIYAEGISTGQATITLRLEGRGAIIAIDSVLLSVIKGDLRAFRQQTPVFQEHEIPDAMEQHIGIRRNLDDDDENGVPDAQQTGNTINEDDTMKVAAVFLGTYGVDLVLSRSNTAIQVYTSKDRSGPIFGTGQLISTVDVGAVFWAEWTTASLENSATLTLLPRVTDTGTVGPPLDSITYEPFTNITIVVMGEFHEPADPAIHPADNSTMGLMQWAIDQYRYGYDVYAFGESDYLQNTTEREYSVIRNAVNNRGVTSVAMIGYSHGGGEVWNVAERLIRDPLSNYYDLVFTGFIDAISQAGFWGFAPGTFGSVNLRPYGSQFHVNQYQQNTSLNGGNLNGANTQGDVDIDRSPLGVVHTTIDDSSSVLSLLEQLFRAVVSK